MIGIAASRTAIEYEYEYDYRCTEYQYDESNRCRLGTRSLR